MHFIYISCIFHVGLLISYTSCIFDLLHVHVFHVHFTLVFDTLYNYVLHDVHSTLHFTFFYVLHIYLRQWHCIYFSTFFGNLKHISCKFHTYLTYLVWHKWIQYNDIWKAKEVSILIFFYPRNTSFMHLSAYCPLILLKDPLILFFQVFLSHKPDDTASITITMSNHLVFCLSKRISHPSCSSNICLCPCHTMMDSRSERTYSLHFHKNANSKSGTYLTNL